jgi:hypothetical protein
MSTFSPQRETASPDSGLGEDEVEVGVVEKTINGVDYLMDEKERELFDLDTFTKTGEAVLVGYWCKILDRVAEYSDEDITPEGYAILKTEFLAAMDTWQTLKNKGGVVLPTRATRYTDKDFLKDYFQIDVKFPANYAPGDLITARKTAPEKIEGIVAVDRESWEKFQTQLAGYKNEKEKQKKFKEYLIDKRGERARVIYRDGSFYEKTSKKRVVLPELVLGDEANMLGCINSIFGLMSVAWRDGWFADKLTEEQKIKIHNDLEQGIIDKNHTGNHYRNHTVKCGRGLYGRHN